MRRIFLLVGLIYFFILDGALAAVCKQWSAPAPVGHLDFAVLPEASGLAVSRVFPGRMYHNNDSGDGPYFYVTDLTGAGTQKVTTPQFKAEDVEDIAVGPCGSQSCVFIADIGDNGRLRSSVELKIVLEEPQIQATAQVFRSFKLVYPDGPRDAEALAVHPLTGDVYIVSKEADYTGQGRTMSAGLYRLPAANITGEVKAGEKSLTLDKIGLIDVPWINATQGFYGQIVTSMDISADGTRMLLLTYENAIEIDFAALQAPIQTQTWTLGKEYSVANWPRLTSQQEAVGYAVDGKSFYFDSEFNPLSGDKESILYRVNCL